MLRRVLDDASEDDAAASRILASDPDAVVSRQQILQQVWGARWFGHSKTIDVHVASLRRKLGDPGWIEAVRGVGFRLRPIG